MATPYRRKTPTPQEIVAILTRQGADLTALPLAGLKTEKAIWNALEANTLTVPCGNPKCGQPIHKRADCVRDHKIPLRTHVVEARSLDQPWNQWYLCLDCNRTKTSKRGLAGLGSDAARIAKLRRIEKGDQDEPCRAKSIRSSPFSKPWTKPTGKASIPARPFPKGQRKLVSRPFPKRAKAEK